MPYDKIKSTEAVLPGGIFAAEIEAFCADMGLEFYAVGDYTDWTRTDLFTVGTPNRGINTSGTVEFLKVRQWLQAKAEMGERLDTMGVYITNTSEILTTICTAFDTETKREVIVYRDTSDKVFTMPVDKFYGVVSIDDVLRARVRRLSPTGRKMDPQPELQSFPLN